MNAVKTVQLKNLKREILSSLPDAVFFPTKGRVRGFVGTAPVMCVGNRAVKGGYAQAFERILYSLVAERGLGDIHLTDIIKTPEETLSVDHDMQARCFEQEIGIIKPRLVIAFGQHVYEQLRRLLADKDITLRCVFWDSYISQGRGRISVFINQLERELDSLKRAQESMRRRTEEIRSRNREKRRQKTARRQEERKRLREETKFRNAETQRREKLRQLRRIRKSGHDDQRERKELDVRTSQQRGDFSERIFERRLDRLVEQKVIVAYRKYDRHGIDYIVFLPSGARKLVQVKTSVAGASRHRRKYGAKIPVVVVNQGNTRKQMMDILNRPN